jgi:F0F1-type ATP synthase assembly protein I
MPEVPADNQPTESAPPAVRAQILSTEHWSLLATRSLAWSESFSRASWFVTVVSATMVALALVAQSTDFGVGFQIFALLVIPLLVVIGVATVIRLVQLNGEDVELVIGMNRLRRGYLAIAPELEEYFITGHREDIAGIMRTYGTRRTRIPATQYVSSIALLVSVIVAVLVGALAGLVADTFGAGRTVAVIVGIVAGIATLATVVLLIVRHARRTWDRN